MLQKWIIVTSFHFGKHSPPPRGVVFLRLALKYWTFTGEARGVDLRFRPFKCPGAVWGRLGLVRYAICGLTPDIVLLIKRPFLFACASVVTRSWVWRLRRSDGSCLYLSSGEGEECACMGIFLWRLNLPSSTTTFVTDKPCTGGTFLAQNNYLEKWQRAWKGAHCWLSCLFNPFCV